jgi:hypothetical protein
MLPQVRPPWTEEPEWITEPRRLFDSWYVVNSINT